MVEQYVSTKSVVVATGRFTVNGAVNGAGQPVMRVISRTIDPGREIPADLLPGLAEYLADGTIVLAASPAGREIKRKVAAEVDIRRRAGEALAEDGTNG